MMIPSQNPFPGFQLKIQESPIFVIQFLLGLQLQRVAALQNHFYWKGFMFLPGKEDLFQCKN